MAQSVSPLVFRLSSDLADVDGSRSQLADMGDWQSSAFTADLSRRDYYLAAGTGPDQITVAAGSARTHTAWRAGCRAIAGELHRQSEIADGLQAHHTAAAAAAEAEAAVADATARDCARAAEDTAAAGNLIAAAGFAADAAEAQAAADAARAEADRQLELARLAGIWCDDADAAASQGDDLTARYDRLFRPLNEAVAATAGDRTEDKNYGVL